MLARALIAAGSVAIAGVISSQATAAQMNLASFQAEWVQNYEVATSMRVPRADTPILSREALAATEQAIARYADIVARGGWGVVPNQHLSLGDRSSAVLDLRRRLVLSGDLDPTVQTSDIFDSFVEAAVRRFQNRHGLSASGSLNGPTLTALNIPADVRLRQLNVNVARLRSYPADLGDRYVIVNIPSATVEAVAGGAVALHLAAGVGRIDRQSPIFNSRVVEVNFNPYWTVPASIIRRDLVPKMQQDPNYLTEMRIRIYNGRGEEIDPTTVNWHSAEPMRFLFRQDSGGEFNSLGFVRLNIPNSYGVYMHDTPERGIFGEDFRFVSSGCVRVQSVRDLVEFLLADTPGWDRAEIDATFRSGERIDVRLNRALNVYWSYITAWGTPGGMVHFRDDVYERDGVRDLPLAKLAASEKSRN